MHGKLKVIGTEYQPSEAGSIFAQIFNPDGTPANSSAVSLTLFKSDGAKILDGVSMSYVIDSSGIYKYDFTAPADTGVYIADVSSTSPTAYGCDEVHVSTALAHIDAGISSVAGAVWDELMDGHKIKGSYGKAVYDILIRGIKSIAQWREKNK